MLKETHFFLLVILVVILLMAVFSFLLVYSLLPHEDQAPRRSRPVSISVNFENTPIEYWNHLFSREVGFYPI